jgi:hypothetical protein
MPGTTELPDLPILRPSTSALADQLDAAGQRFAAALSAASPGARAGRLTWTAHDLGAHLATGIAGSHAFLRDEASHLTDLAAREEAGAAAIAAEADTSMEDLAARIADGASSFAADLRLRSADDRCRFYATQLPAGTLGALLLNELTVHGHDLAGIPVPPTAATIGALAPLALLPMLVKPGTPRDATIGFDVRGHGGVVVELRGDAVELRSPGGRVDVRLSAEPVTFLLAVYGRASQGRSMLTGRLSVRGRRPWRLRALQTRFDTA